MGAGNTTKSLTGARETCPNRSHALTFLIDCRLQLRSNPKPGHRTVVLVVRTVGSWLCVMALASLGCKSSDDTPVDPTAVAYCEICVFEFNNCETVVGDALEGLCPEETRVYYECVTASACEPSACQDEWAARETCFLGPEAGAAGAGGR